MLQAFNGLKKHYVKKNSANEEHNKRIKFYKKLRYFNGLKRQTIDNLEERQQTIINQVYIPKVQTSVINVMLSMVVRRRTLF